MASLAAWPIGTPFASSAGHSREPRNRRSYGEPALKVKGKLFVWMSPNREARGALAVRVDPEEKELILEANPGVYFTVPHYDGHPIVLVRLEAIGRDELRERIEDAWLLEAPKRLVDEYVAGSS